MAGNEIQVRREVMLKRCGQFQQRLHQLTVNKSEPPGMTRKGGAKRIQCREKVVYSRCEFTEPQYDGMISC